MTTLALTDEHAKMGKISNNLEWAGEEQHVTGFTIPVELQVPRPQLVLLMGEAFDRAVWMLDASGVVTGVDWARRLLPLALGEETYVGVAAQMNLGGRELEYADCRFSKIVILALGNGGITHVKGHLYVRPGIGSENLLLQEFQEHEIAVSISSGKLRVKADKKQQQLPLEPPGSSASPAAGDPPAGVAADAAPEGQGKVPRRRSATRRTHASVRLRSASSTRTSTATGLAMTADDEEDDDSMSSLGQQIVEHAARAS